MGPIVRFLTFWAGTDSSLLMLCPRHIRQKYISIGVLVLLTASFASVAAGYTFWTIFESLGISVALGALWGTFILNLDRLLLTTFPKNATYFRQILHAIPRLALAVMIGITIAHPLMLRLFKPEIMERVAYDDEKKVKLAVNERIAADNDARARHEKERMRLPESDRLEQRRIGNDEAQVALGECVSQANTAEAELKCELDGGCGTGKKGVGPVSRKKEALWREKKRACQDLQQALKDLEGMLVVAENEFGQAVRDRESSLTAQLEQIATDHNATLKRLTRSRDPSFLTRSEALGSLVKDREQAKATHFGIMLLLILVEVVPVLMKVIMPRDSLDELSYATADAFVKHIPQLSEHLAKHSQFAPAAPSVTVPPTANPLTGGVSAKVRRRIRAAAIIFVTVIMMTWMPSFNLSYNDSVTSAALFVAVAPFILALVGGASPEESGL